MRDRTTSSLDVGTEVLADLNRLLREGLVRVDVAFEADVPRFQITPAGRRQLALETSETVSETRARALQLITASLKGV